MKLFLFFYLRIIYFQMFIQVFFRINDRFLSYNIKKKCPKIFVYEHIPCCYFHIIPTINPCRISVKKFGKIKGSNYMNRNSKFYILQYLYLLSPSTSTLLMIIIICLCHLIIVLFSSF